MSSYPYVWVMSHIWMSHVMCVCVFVCTQVREQDTTSCTSDTTSCTSDTTSCTSPHRFGTLWLPLHRPIHRYVWHNLCSLRNDSFICVTCSILGVTWLIHTKVFWATLQYATLVSDKCYQLMHASTSTCDMRERETHTHGHTHTHTPIHRYGWRKSFTRVKQCRYMRDMTQS